MMTINLWYIVQLYCSAGWTPPGLPLVSDPVGGVHGRDLKVQSWRGVCFGEPWDLSSAFCRRRHSVGALKLWLFAQKVPFLNS